MKSIRCDHCGTEFTKEEYRNYFVTKTITHEVHVLKKTKDFVHEVKYDLCDSCYKKLLEWVNDEEEHE